MVTRQTKIIENKNDSGQEFLKHYCIIATKWETDSIEKAKHRRVSKSLQTYS